MRTATGLWAIWVTGVAEHADHAVTDEQMTTGMKTGAGIYRAVCGAEVLAAPLVTPPAPRCPACEAVLRGPLPDMLTAYCGMTITPGAAELLDAPAGMPCVPCLTTAPMPSHGAKAPPERLRLDGSGLGKDITSGD